jgi:precorrin-3B C17-methyltransferase
MSGTIYLVGLGPGKAAQITPEARGSLKKASVIIGSKDSLRQAARLIRGKERVSTAHSPVERAMIASEKALAGIDTAIVSPGHPGVYAIASTLFAYLKAHNLDVPVEVVPGLTLADYAAARLGSPIGADHAVVSLADRAGDWRDTKKRLMAALAADFALVIYNPRGKLDGGRLKTLLKLAGGYRTPGTPVGMLSEAGGRKERSAVSTMGELDLKEVRNNTLLIIGNSQTYVYRGRMVTPRPYQPETGY